MILSAEEDGEDADEAPVFDQVEVEDRAVLGDAADVGAEFGAERTLVGGAGQAAGGRVDLFQALVCDVDGPERWFTFFDGALPMKRQIAIRSRRTPGAASSVQTKIAPILGKVCLHPTLQFIEGYGLTLLPLFQKHPQKGGFVRLPSHEFQPVLDHRAEAAEAAFGDEAAGEGVLLVGERDGGFHGHGGALRRVVLLGSMGGGAGAIKVPALP